MANYCLPLVCLLAMGITQIQASDPANPAMDIEDKRAAWFIPRMGQMREPVRLGHKRSQALFAGDVGDVANESQGKRYWSGDRASGARLGKRHPAAYMARLARSQHRIPTGVGWGKRAPFDPFSQFTLTNMPRMVGKRYAYPLQTGARLGKRITPPYLRLRWRQQLLKQG